MANNRIQIKRTSVSGRTANVTSSGNAQYIAAGELALNMADGILYSSNGSSLVEIGSNTTTQRITNSLTLDNNKPVRFNTVNTSAASYFIQQSDDNFVFYSTNTTYGSRPIWSIYANSVTSNLQFSVPIQLNSGLVANGSIGAAGQTLASNGSAVYWATVTGTGTVTQVSSANGIAGGPITTSGTLYVVAGNNTIFVNASGIHVNTNAIPPGTNVNAQYTWNNSHTFQSNVAFTGNNISVVSNTGSVMFAGSSDTNWRIGRSTGSFTKTFYTNNSLDIIAANSNLEGVAFGFTGNSVYFETGYAGTFTLNPIYVGNSSVNVSINSTSFSGTANNALRLGGLLDTSYLRSDASGYYSGGVLRFTNDSSAYGNTTGEANTLQIYQPISGADAFQTFHVSGDTAVHFGLDGTTNDLFVGGWSLGANKYKVWHQNNDGAGSGLDADTLDGSHASAFQTTAGLAANVATLTANNTSFVGAVTAANVVSNAQLSGNLANYVTTTALTNNLANYQTTAGLSANVATLTANNTTYVNGKTESNLNVNSAVYANGSATNTFTVGTGTYFVSSGNMGIGETNPQRKLTVRADNAGSITAAAFYNADTTANNGTVFSFRSDTSGVGATTFQEFAAVAARYDDHNHATRSGSLDFFTVNNGTGVNRLRVAANGNVGIANLTPDATLAVTGTANVSGNVAIAGITTFNANVVLGSSGLSANGGFGIAGHVLHSNGTATYWAADDQGVTSVASGNGITGGTITSTGTLSAVAGTGTVVNTTGIHVNATYIGTLSANNTTYVNGKTEGNLNVNSATTALTANNSTNLGGVAAASYQLNSTLAANVATLTANNTSFVGTVSAANVVSNAQLSGNLANYVTTTNLTNNLTNYQTTAGLSANVATLTANNADYLDGQHGAYYTNATNITTGILPYAQIPSNVINTTAAFTISGVHTYNANVILGSSGLSANTSFGTAGQVLHSNGTATYWAADDQGVTSVATGNGLTGGTITTTGTVSVLANTGIVANATGVYVNATYIGTLSANNTTYVNGKTEGNLNVNSAVYSTNSINANNADYLDGQHGAYYAANSLLANYALLSGASFTGNVTANNANTLNNLNVGGNLTVAGNLTVTGNVTTIGANNLSIVDNFIYLNSNNTTQNIDLGFAGNYNDGTYRHSGFFRDATDSYWKIFDGYAPEPDANVNIDTANATFNIAGFWANNIRLGNSTIYGTINSTSYSGTANNTSFVGSVSAANVVSNAQLSGNLASYVTTTALTNNLTNYQTTAGLSANVATLTANNTSFVGSVSAANVVSNAQLSANLTNYQTTAGLSANVATLTANNANYVKANNGITSNSSGVFVTQGTGVVVNATGVHVNATYIGTLSANNATYLNGKTEGNLNTNTSSTSTKLLTPDTRAAVTTPETLSSPGIISDFKQNTTEGLSDGGSYFGEITFRPYGNNTDWSGGPSHQLAFTTNNNIYFRSGTNTTWGSWKKIIDSSTNSTLAGNLIFSANVTLNGLIANGSIGTAGQVLHSNGTATYWAADDNAGGTVTSVASGNGITGGTITSTGTLSAVAGTGTVVNATGIHVNATYIATIASNSATYANASITNTFTVGTSTYFVSNGNVGIGTNGPTRILDVVGSPMFRSSGTSAVFSTFRTNDSSSLGYVGVEGNAGGTTLTGTLNNATFLSSGASGTALQFGTVGAIRATISASGNVGIGTTAPAYTLQVNGSFAATTKSFVIDHPTKPDMKLRYGSLEGPENGVYVRGKSTSKVIELPDYWEGLVDEDSITVTLTPIGKKQRLYVKEIRDNSIVIGGSWNPNYYYTVYAERKDVVKLVVEF